MSRTIRCACRNKHEENWNGFYVSLHCKLAKKLGLTPTRVANLWSKYSDARGEAYMDDAEDYMSFEEWLQWQRIIPA